MIYTWDFAALRNLAPVSGEVRKETMFIHPGPLPSWMDGLACRSVHELPPPKSGFEVVTQVLPAGRQWVEEFYAYLDRKFPHGEEGPGFIYYGTARGTGLLYNPGFELEMVWPQIFGVVAPPAKWFRRAPASFRPWTADQQPTVFHDGNRKDWASTDSLGAPYNEGSMTQVQIDWAYCGAVSNETVPLILKDLKSAAPAWACGVQPHK